MTSDTCPKAGNPVRRNTVNQKVHVLRKGLWGHWRRPPMWPGLWNFPGKWKCPDF